MQEMEMQNVQRFLANHAIYLLHPLVVRKYFAIFSTLSSCHRLASAQAKQKPISLYQQAETLRSLEYLVPGWMLNEEQCGNLSSELLFHRSGVSYCTLESYCKDLIIFSSTSSLQGNCIMCVPSRINIVRGPYMHNMQEYAITNVTTCSRSKDFSPSQDDFCDLWYGRPHGLRTSLCGLTPSSPISVQC